MENVKTQHLLPERTCRLNWRQIFWSAYLVEGVPLSADKGKITAAGPSRMYTGFPIRLCYEHLKNIVRNRIRFLYSCQEKRRRRQGVFYERNKRWTGMDITGLCVFAPVEFHLPGCFVGKPAGKHFTYKVKAHIYSS